jgi:hypothetical protein
LSSIGLGSHSAEDELRIDSTAKSEGKAPKTFLPIYSNQFVVDSEKIRPRCRYKQRVLE